MRIHQHLAGRTVEWVRTDGHRLVIRTTCGHEVRVVWQEHGWLDGRDHVYGYPRLEAVDVRIMLPQAGEIRGAGGTL